jgi:transcriptional regulator with XRE-family HTH domain
MSQQELAEKVGYKTASAVNKIELGLRDINQTKIVLFAEALGTTPSYLMGWTEEKSSPGVEEKTPRERKYDEIISLLQALPEEKVTEAIRYLKYLADN